MTADELERDRNAEGFLDLKLTVSRNGEGAQAPRPLQPGDQVTLAATGLGTLSNRVVTGVEPTTVPAGRRRIG